MQKSPSYNEKIKNKIDEIITLNVSFETFESEEIKRKETIIEGFKSMFLITGVFCLLVLIFGGFEQIRDDQCFKIRMILWVYIFATFILLFNLFIFIMSFIKKIIINIKYYHISLYFIIVLIICITYCFFIKYHNYFEKIIEYNTSFIVFLLIPITPYLFHFIKTYSHRKEYKNKMKELQSSISSNLDDVEKLINFLVED